MTCKKPAGEHCTNCCAVESVVVCIKCSDLAQAMNVGCFLPMECDVSHCGLRHTPQRASAQCNLILKKTMCVFTAAQITVQLVVRTTFAILVIKKPHDGIKHLCNHPNKATKKIYPLQMRSPQEIQCTSLRLERG